MQGRQGHGRAHPRTQRAHASTKVQLAPSDGNTRHGVADAVVLDNQMPGPAIGLELLPVMRERWPELPIVMMTAFGGRLTADEALRRGATAVNREE
ncbi:MAG: response regulator [Candidatus Rokuibacteriota bacterium]